jgi:hypothetical protein
MKGETKHVDGWLQKGSLANVAQKRLQPGVGCHQRPMTVDRHGRHGFVPFQNKINGGARWP